MKEILLSLKVNKEEETRINYNTDELRAILRRAGLKMDRTKYILLVEREYGDEIIRLVKIMTRTLDPQAVKKFLRKD